MRCTMKMHHINGERYKKEYKDCTEKSREIVHDDIIINKYNTHMYTNHQVSFDWSELFKMVSVEVATLLSPSTNSLCPGRPDKLRTN